jgi:serine/threonine-protein kinase
LIELRILGSLDLRGPEGGEIRPVLNQPKRTALLAYLAVARPRGFHRRDKLMGMFSPETDDERARSALRSSLHYLRQAVGREIILNRGSGEVGLDRDQIWCDVLAFEEAAEAGRVDEALDLYRGDLLDGVFLSDCPAFERWLEGEREGLREMASGAAWSLAHQQIRVGTLVDAERTGQRALALVSTDESAVRDFIRDLAHAGDRAAAIRFYEKFADGLARDLDLRPAAESRDLAAGIRASMEIAVGAEASPAATPGQARDGKDGRRRGKGPEASGKAEAPARSPLDRLKAALASRYAIEKEIGRGGMGTVYRATDLKHQRKVAVKVLSSEIAAVVEADRFLKEIETAASLTHPYILPVHDSGRANGILYFVSPYVATESLRARLEKERQLPVADAVRIASAVASALDYAHREGVIHRDIKPANILLQDGEPLLSDFGIAVATDTASAGRITGTGLVVGSPEYMSPEQSTPGHVVGPASDIYALGCVLYEMLAGEPPFTGATPQAALARVRSEDPRPLSGLRSMIPPNVNAAIRKALEKAPADRFISGKEFARALADPGFRHGRPEAPSPGRWTRTALAGWAAAAILALVWVGSLFTGSPPETSVLFARPLFMGPQFAIAPDGSMIVYGEGEGAGPLHRWALEDTEAFPISGTDGAEEPAFSPDGRSIVFRVGGFIKTVPVFGGSMTTVVTAPEPPLGAEANIMVLPTHPAWGDDGMVYFAQGSFIKRVRADGDGVAEEFTAERGWLPGFPEPLPEGRGVLFTVRHWDHAAERREDSVAVVGPDGGEPRELVKGVSAKYLHPGYLLYTTWDGSLLAAPFDLGSLDVTGPSVTLMGGDPERAAIQVRFSGEGSFDLSRSGTLVYQSGGALPHESVLCRVEDGHMEPLDSTWRGEFTDLALSPDGSRFAVMETRETVQEIWISALDGTPRRVWTSPKSIFGLGWTADGSAVTYVESLDPFGDPMPPNYGIPYLKAVDSDELPQGLLPTEVAFTGELIAWHPRGESFAYSAGEEGGSEPAGIWVSHFGSDDPPTLLVESSPDHHNLQPQAFSPDGRYLAYLAQETPRTTHADLHQVWVISLEDPARKPERIDTSPANRVRWSRDGKVIYFTTWDGTTRGIEVETDPAFSWSRISEVYYHGPDAGPIEVSPDRRFFLLRSWEWLDSVSGGNEYFFSLDYSQVVMDRLKR